MLGVAVSAVREVISALVLRELIEDAAAELPELIDGPFRPVAQQLLELGEGQFDRIQIRRIRWQVSQLGAGSLDRFADPGDFVAGEVVHHHDVTRLQDRS